MADYTNPAGRLHEVLTRFGRKPNVSILDGWAAALGVDQSEVPYHLGRVAALLDDVRRAAGETGSPAFQSMPGHLDVLARSIFPTSKAFNTPVANVMPDPNAMQLLGALSFALELSSPEGTIPDEQELDDLKQSVRTLIDDVSTSDLPPEVRRALLHRLAEMLEALEHLEIGGPSAVQRAAESLAVTAALYGQEAEGSGTVREIATVARKAWRAFAVATAIAASVLTWDKLGEMTGVLGQGQEQRQLPPGRPSPAGEKPPVPHPPEEP